MKKQHLIPTTLLSAFLLATSPVLADAKIADVDLSSAGVNFALSSSLEGSLSLTVSGPGDFYVQQDFKAGETPYLSAFDKAGNARQAGIYTWTLTHNPVASGDRSVAAATKAWRQNGSFTVLADGSLANPNLIEGGLDKAQVFADDLIVQGSGCIGFDCTTSENFGSDTFRLKENNLRIHFDDTSASASFPGNDWRLTANDSTNGGADYFAIEDATAGRQVFRVEADAIVNALYVDAEGDVGVGTATPVVEVHAVDGNSPAFRLEQDGSDGFAAQTWDIAGNETNFFIRDVTNSSKLPFRIKPGAGDDALFIGASGNVGMGTDSPGQELEVKADTPAIRLNGTTFGKSWDLNMNGTGRLNWNLDDDTKLRIDAQSNSNLLNIGVDAADIVSVNGSITATGSITPDYVFESDYNLLSIDEHADFMWREKHLPHVEAAKVNAEGKGLINLSSRAQGTLEELELAHIYIQQLHERLENLEAQISEADTE